MNRTQHAGLKTKALQPPNEKIQLVANVTQVTAGRVSKWELVYEAPRPIATRLLLASQPNISRVAGAPDQLQQVRTSRKGLKHKTPRQRILGKVGKRIVFGVFREGGSYLNQPGILLLRQLQLLLMLLLTKIHNCYRLLLGKVACNSAVPNRMIEKNSTWCCRRNNPKYATPCAA